MSRGKMVLATAGVAGTAELNVNFDGDAGAVRPALHSSRVPESMG